MKQSVVRLILLIVVALGVTGSPALAQDPRVINAPIPDAPREVEFPRDSGPHDEATTEWWYYTGHLTTESGDLYGFEYVTFRAVLGSVEGFVSHFAITDNPSGKFTFDQKIVAADGVRGTTAAMDLNVDGWTMVGEGGNDRLLATMDGYGINLKLDPGKPAALHQGDGYIDYGNGTHSWYYSRTNMPIEGVLRVGEENLRVTGTGWMDHQWGNFTTFNDGGWDWFALRLDDDTELMLYVVHDREGRPLVVDGSIVAPDGTLTVLDDEDFTIETLSSWTSPKTGTVWPNTWRVTVPTMELDVVVTPTMDDQELDTRFSTRIIYWEGQSTIEGTRAGAPVTGLGYVELTGYAPIDESGPLGPVGTPEASS